MRIITWDQRLSAGLPPGWDPEAFRLTNGQTVTCPYDGRQPYIAKPRFVRMADNIAWASKLNSDYRKFSDDIMRNDPQDAGAVVGYRTGQAETFARAVAQKGQFDYQRPPGADMFLTFYTSFASYNFGVLGYYAGFTLAHLFQGGGSQNWLHAMLDRLTHWGRTHIDDSAASGLSQLNEWCIRRAFADCTSKLVG